jgi:hypothetical protein
MRTTLLIGLAAATLLTSPAVASDRHHRGREVHRVTTESMSPRIATGPITA